MPRSNLADPLLIATAIPVDGGRARVIISSVRASRAVERDSCAAFVFSTPIGDTGSAEQSRGGKMTGGYVSLAGLKLFQIEEQPGDDGGVQSWGTGMTFVTRLRGCSPNPFARATSVNYELAQYGPVELTLHDVSGRLVRRLESGPRQRGFHVVRWDGTDGRGRVVPSGVYFVCFAAGGKVSTGRVTLVR